MEIKLKTDHLLELKALSPSIREKLIEGCEEEELVKQIEGEKRPSGLTYFYYYLNLAKQHEFLCYQTPLIELTPLSKDFTLVGKLPVGKFQISRFALCRLHEGKLVWESPLSPSRVQLRVDDFLSFFSNPVSLEEAQKQFPEISETIRLLLSAQVLTIGEECVVAQQWEFHDLYFHSRSRRGRHDTPFGGTYRFKEQIPPLPGVKACSGKDLLSLDFPNDKLSVSLEAVIEERKSIREHDEKPISKKKFSEFLYRVARVKKSHIFEGQEMTSRPYPGGGARYELELYPVIYDCEGIERGVYHYHPIEHALCQVSEMNDLAEQLLIDACHSSGKEEYPQILILVAARFQRVSWKYQSMAYGLILKNLGVLLQTMYLVATAMKLAPCALGGGNSDLFCKVAGTSYLEETSVGEFMLGSIPRG